MITFDGERSKKRKWLADKQLSIIKDINVPAKAVKYDGFTFKVWQQDDLSGGRITAPMGAVVVCSSRDNIKISVAEYWCGAFVTYADAYNIYYAANGNDPRIKVFNMPSEEDMISDGNQTVKFRPMGTLSPYGLIDGNIEGPDTVYVQNHVCMPGLMPYKGAEGFWFGINDNVFIDLNNNGTADFPKYIYDNTILFYISNGSNLGGRQELSLQIGGGTPSASVTQPWRITQQVSETKQVQHQFYLYEAYTNKFFCAWEFDFPTYTPIYLEDVIPTGTMPEALRSIILDVEGITASWPLGNYAARVGENDIFLHVNNATNTVPWTGSSPSGAYFSDHPEHENWKLSYSLTVGGTTAVIDSSQFIALLDSLTTLDVLADWNDARRMLAQLLPFPNANWGDPYDSVMFHAHTGDIYTWTRKYGAVRFSLTGLFAATLIIPDEVTTEEGVRPDITYAGSYNEEPMYLCICNKVTEEIKAVYYGSPFTIWTALPMVDTGQTLVHVRPVKVSPERIMLIGVIKETITINEVPTEVYFFSSLTWTPGSTDLWIRMGQLPFTVSDYDQLQVGLYGNDISVYDLATYPSPPPILPQMPVGPYAKYAIGIPP